MYFKENFSSPIYFLIVILLLLCINSCKDDPPSAPDPTIVLKDTLSISVAGITHRSISVNIKSTLNNKDNLIRLYKLLSSSQIMLSEFPVMADTIIIDDNNGNGLLLNSENNYYAVRIDTNGQRIDSSNLIQAVTLDTTTHSYTWQEYVFGDLNGISISTLYDAWGTDENNVWAVGGVLINDKWYGGAKWDGSSWKFDSTYGGYSIHGFSANDIWVAGGTVFHFNGFEWKRIADKVNNGNVTIIDTILFENGDYRAVWGTSSSNMYFGSVNGKIIHWNGIKASIFYDLGVVINDIHGSSADNIWVTAQSFSEPITIVAHFNGTEWEVQYLPVKYRDFYTVYTKDKSNVIIGGNGIHQRQNNEWFDMGVNVKGSFYKIRGINTNDLFAVGSWGKVFHYNGNSWKQYLELYTWEGGIYYGVYHADSKVFITGLHQNFFQAKILIGTKN